MKVNSFTLEKISDILYKLTINTVNKWPAYEVWSNTEICVEGEVIKLDNFLPKLNRGVWLQSTTQNKDQIFVIWNAWMLEDKGEVIQCSAVIE